VFAGAGRAFLAETYVPGLDEPAAVSLSSCLREAIRQLAEEGVVLRWDGSFALVDEETFICIIRAANVDDVVELSKRAGFEPDHVVEAFAIDAPATQGR
jgi:DNA-binding GntR family transcriptional regulator